MVTQQAPTANASAAPIGGTTALIKIVSLAAGFVMSIVDTTVINVAGPEVQHSLHTTLTGLTWIVDGYTLAFAALLLLAGSLANRYGAKTVYQLGIAVFVTASLLCAAAPTSGALVGGRIAQGVGAALCMPSSLALLAHTFPDPGQRTKMVGIWSSIISGAAAAGPMLGGVLVSSLGWRGIFLLNLPIGAVGLALARRQLAPVPGRRFKPALSGHLWSVICLAALCFSVIEGPRDGWTSPPIVAAVLVALAAAGAFRTTERRAWNPILPPALFARPGIRGLNGVSFLLNFGLFSVIYMFGLFVQNARGAGPLMAGVQMLPLWGLFVVGNIVFTRISRTTGTRRPMVLGLAVAAAASAALVLVRPGTPYAVLAALIGLASVCIGITVPAMTAGLVAAAGPEHAGTAGSTLNATRQVGTLLGVAAAGAIMNGAAGWYQAASLIFLVAALCYACSSFLALRSTRGG